MPDFQAGVRSRLIAAATSAGSRIYWVERPQLSALPAVTLQTISDPRPQHLKGLDGARPTRVQVDCWAATYAVALALARACIGALQPPTILAGKKFGQATIEGQRDLGEDQNGTLIHRQSVDLIIWHVGD